MKTLNRLVVGAAFLLAGWIGPTFKTIHITIARDEVLQLSLNQVYALCSSALGQLG